MSDLSRVFCKKVGDFLRYRSESLIKSGLKSPRSYHAGREAWFRSQNRVALLHNGIRKGKIKKPELHDIVPGTFGKNKGIRIELKEIGYKGILIGGMTARITR